MLQLRITARGLVPSIGLLLALVALPYVLAGTLSVQEAESLVAGIHERRAVEAFLERERVAPSVTAEARLRAEEQLDRRRAVRFASVRVRRGLMVPPFSRRTTFLIEARLAGAAEPEYFRVSRGSAYSSNAFWWHIRL